MSVPCEIKVYIRIGAQRCGSHRQPGARADRILKMAGTKRFLTAYINRARLDKTVTEFLRAFSARKNSPVFEWEFNHLWNIEFSTTSFPARHFHSDEYFIARSDFQTVLFSLLSFFLSRSTARQLVDDLIRFENRLEHLCLPIFSLPLSIIPF